MFSIPLCFVASLSTPLCFCLSGAVMAHQSVENDRVENLQPAHVDNIELDDLEADNHAPLVEHSPNSESGLEDDHRADNQAAPPGQSLDSESRLEDDDGQPPCQTNLKATLPAQPQRAVVITPLRVSMMVFDGILASTPIMFIGKLPLTQPP
jgi:hypothetical protein